MLKKRIVTALFLIPIFVALLIKLPAPMFMVLTSVILLLGAWEWSQLMGLKKKSHRMCYVFFIFVLVNILFFSKTSSIISIPTTLYVTFYWWLLAAVLIVIYPKASSVWGRGLFFRAIMGAVVLIPTWIALNFIRLDFGVWTLLFLFVLIWGADTGAYFSGKKWGKNKLAPKVSPGKTRQGLYGALIITVPIVIAALCIAPLPYRMWPAAFALAFTTVIFSIIGDLFESMLKRNVGIKDSGTLIPGHGGLLDRIDSLTAAAPVFALGCWLFAKIM
ncbi:MAG: phosphatidate cytidylyltransferase [Gammaproteobacteria bacterium]|nr:phosphatidate cytidylyltransferase [Gammaproteobacteria bacterium]